MPVQIDELVIRTTINTSDAGSTAANPAAPTPAAMDDEIAEKVLEIIREKSER